MSDFCDIRLDEHSITSADEIDPRSGVLTSATRLLGRAGSRLTRRIRLRLDGGLYRSRRERQRLWAESGISLGLWSGGPGFDPAHLSAGLVIGRYCSFGARLTIATQNHPCDRSSTSAFFYEPSLGAVPSRRLPPDPTLLIGHDVWFGANASITPGCRLVGHGAVIGAGSVVTKSVPSLAIVAGNPARIVRWRMEGALRADWLRSRWWRFPPESLCDLPGFGSSLEEEPRLVDATATLPGSQDSEALRRFDGLVERDSAEVLRSMPGPSPRGAGPP